MTDRHSGYVVILDHDIREDDAEQIRRALAMVRGVRSVRPVTAQPAAEMIWQGRRDSAWRQALYTIAADGPEPPDGG